MLDLARFDEALATLGEVLLERGHRCEVLVVGGGSLLLLGLIARPTADIDVIGAVTPTGYAKLDVLPVYLTEAAQEVAVALGLGPAWLNVGPAGLVDFGLPPGLEDRVEVRTYGGLVLHLPGRLDLICFKLYAAADLGDGKHVQDLESLAPTVDELQWAARWTRTHDPSPGFLPGLNRVLERFGTEFHDAAS